MPVFGRHRLLRPVAAEPEQCRVSRPGRTQMGANGLGDRVPCRILIEQAPLIESAPEPFPEKGGNVLDIVDAPAERPDNGISVDTNKESVHLPYCLRPHGHNGNTDELCPGEASHAGRRR
ncbi:hypothetical protein GCM10009736_55560 [Actinomadura bangladeshensis]